jgi:hypothetical protein
MLLAPFWRLPEGYEIPNPIWHRGLPAEDIKVPIVGTDFVKDLLGAVPLVNDVFDQVLVSLQPKTDRPLVRFPSRVTLNLQLHLISILGLPPISLNIAIAASM